MAIYAGSVGVRFNVTVGAPFNISAPGYLDVIVAPPNGGSFVVVPAVDSGPAGTCHFFSTAGQLDAPGPYKIRARWRPAGVEDTNSYLGPTTSVTVEP